MDAALVAARDDGRREAIGDDPEVAEEVAVGEAGGDRRHDGGAGKAAGGDGLDGAVEVRVGRGDGRLEGQQDFDRDGRLIESLPEFTDEGARLLVGKQPAVQLCRRRGGNDVDLARRLKPGDGAGVTGESVKRRVRPVQRGEAVGFGDQALGVGKFGGRGFEFRQVAKEVADRGHDAGRERVLAEALERLDQVGHRAAGRGARSMAGGSDRVQPQPHRHLLRHLDAEDDPVAQDPAAAALVEHEAGPLQQVRPVAHDPACAVAAARLLVRRGQEDDVAFEGFPGTGEGEEGLQVHDAQALRVEGAAAVEVAVLVGSGHRIVLPEPRVGRYDVDVVEQDDARRLTPFEPCPDAAAAGRGLHGLVGDALALEDVREERDGLALVARRVRRVDAEVLLEPPRGFRQPRIACPVLAHARRRDQGQERSHRRNDHGGGAHRVGRGSVRTVGR